MKPEPCSHCGADLWAPIAPEYQRPGGATQRSRLIGVEIQGVYDGVLFWACPDCGGTWNRWQPGHWLWPLAEKHRTRFTNKYRRENAVGTTEGEVST